MFVYDGGGLGKIININQKLLSSDERNVIITLFLTYPPNRKCTAYQAWGLSRWRTFYRVKYAIKRLYYPVSKCISRFQFFRSLTHLLAEIVIILRSQLRAVQ